MIKFVEIHTTLDFGDGGLIPALVIGKVDSKGIFTSYIETTIESVVAGLPWDDKPREIVRFLTKRAIAELEMEIEEKFEKNERAQPKRDEPNWPEGA